LREILSCRLCSHRIACSEQNLCGGEAGFDARVAASDDDNIIVHIQIFLVLKIRDFIKKQIKYTKI